MTPNPILSHANQFVSRLMQIILNLLALGNFLLLFMAPVLNRSMQGPLFLEGYFLVQLGIFAVYTGYSYWSKPRPERRLSTFIINTLILMTGIAALRTDYKLFLLVILSRQMFIVLRQFVVMAYEGQVWKRLTKNPAATLMLSFLITILIGSLLLMLPAVTKNNQQTPFIDALFTATSAVCVTGLTVVDTGTHFTVFGQLIILFLIQVGGLGIMTISTSLAIVIGQRMSVGIVHLMQNVVGENTRLDMYKLVKNIVLTTLAMEFIGAFFLFFTFRHYTNSVLQGIYYSIFHSVSAFCNAGFGLYPDNLMHFVGNWNINLVVTGLIISGGIGFSVLMDVRTTLLEKISFTRFSLHTKLVLVTTLFLILIGSLAFFISEYHNTMEGFSLKERVLASYFQSVTCRTAGFNTIDESKVSNGTSLVSMILMFIGASPGSTGGGIKTTTFAVMILAILAMMRGSSDVTAFRRRISTQHIREVLSLVGVSVLFVSLLAYVMMLFEPLPFEKIVFEVFSAFGTVGLSRGITALLSSPGKAVIITLMYLGRVGPLTLVFAMSQRRRKFHLQYTEERIGIG